MNDLKFTSRLMAATVLGVGLTLVPEMLPTQTSPAKADVIINAPIIIQGGGHGHRVQEEDTVLVEFVAPGQEWANVRLNGRRVFEPRNFNRRQRLRLEPGAYYLEITGFNRFEVWSTGYLDVGLNDSNVMVVTFSKDRGVSVSNPYAWIPD